MAMYRIKCKKCGYTTQVHYSINDCIKEKEWAHKWGRREQGHDAHDSAFGDMCPKCGDKTEEEYRYFTDSEIEAIKKEAKRL